MVTPLKKTALHELISKPVLFDANIFMVGISERISDERYSFENMKQLYIIPLFESFTNIYIHEEVYKELDDKNRTFVDMYKEKNVSIVGEDGLYGKDPRYTILFNNIATHECKRSIVSILTKKYLIASRQVLVCDNDLAVFLTKAIDLPENSDPCHPYDLGFLTANIQNNRMV